MAKRIPKTLSKETRLIWKKISAEYELSVSEGLLLQTALETYDDFVHAREILEADGWTFSTATGNIHRHPMAVVLKDSRSQFLSAWRDLSFPTIEAPAFSLPGRPKKGMIKS